MAVMDVSRLTPAIIVTTTDREKTLVYEDHYSQCEKWEVSFGKDVSLFGNSADVEDGDVPCFHATDELTVMESVWKAAELGHKVVVKHSRVVVPLFLSFLHDDFFPSCGKEQDARELHLEEVVATKR